MWARVRSPGPLMADKAGARVILYMLTSRSSGGEGEGVVRGKGSGGKREKVKKISSCQQITGVIIGTGGAELPGVDVEDGAEKKGCGHKGWAES